MKKNLIFLSQYVPLTLALMGIILFMGELLRAMVMDSPINSTSTFIAFCLGTVSEGLLLVVLFLAVQKIAMHNYKPSKF